MQKLNQKAMQFSSKKTGIFLSSMQLTIDTSNKSIRSIDSFTINNFLSSKRCPKENKINEFLKNEGIYQISINEVMAIKFFKNICSPVKAKKKLSCFSSSQMLQ